MTIQQQTLPVTNLKQTSLLTTGLALFSMFFGAGNLIFPLLIGQSVGCNAWYAISGLAVTAVVVPFLGLAAMVLFQGDYSRFFGRIGKVPGLMLLLMLQLILGPFGVIPRLVTLMHAMASPYLFDMSLLSFSVLSGVVLFAFSFKREWLINFLGAILTPVLLVALAALMFFGLLDGSSAPAVDALPMTSFFEGLLGGYNTMDLIAAFLFATVILPHFQKETAHDNPEAGQKSILKKMGLSSLIAASLLLATYVGLCLIAARHAPAAGNACPPEQLLNVIAVKLLGPAGGCIAAIAVMTACLTTAMTLASIFADYLRKDICKEKISPAWALVATLAVTTVFANLGFSGIAAFLGPILQVVYPGLILLTVLNLFHALYGYRMVKLPVFLAFGFSGMIDFIPNLI
ncbi:MAG: branched-chain amino acid transport system II carrier protein [Verrucomicrobia bacterium]|nr:branched-chain amino acid transport system II carrier protein [Verrucomicrobiota bacterium]